MAAQRWPPFFRPGDAARVGSRRRAFTVGYVGEHSPVTCANAVSYGAALSMRVNPGLRPPSGRAIVSSMNSLVETGLAQAQPPYSPQQLIEALLAALPAHCVLFREEDTRPTNATACRYTAPAGQRGAARDRGAGAGRDAHLQAPERAGGRARRRHRPVRRRHAAQPGRAAGSVRSIASAASIWPAPPPWSSPACATWRFPKRPLLRLVLCARSLQPDRLFHWRQRGREFRRRALPEVRPDRAQRAARAWSPSTATSSNWAPRRRTRRAWICCRCSSVRKACWAWSPR